MVTLTLSSPNTINSQLSGGAFDPTFSTQIEFRPCQAGEEYTDDGRCVSCLEEFYSLEAPTSVRSCEKCPRNAECLGGDRMTPVQGFWRSGAQSLNFIPCFNPAACKGGVDAVTYEPQG